MPPSIPTPLPSLILISISLTTLFILSSAVPTSHNAAEENATPISVQTQSYPASVSTTTQSQNIANTSRRKKGGHGKMKAEFLTAHNEVRAKHGEPPLKWNQTLERYAQQWATLRAKDCKLAHAPNNQYGENLFWGKYRHWTPREVVKEWADEVAYYNSKTYQCAEGQQCGHYTQIVWKSSAWVGCAKQICMNGEIFVVCEYFPAGNYLDTPDPFTAETSYPGEENNIPQTSGPPNVGTNSRHSSTMQSNTGQVGAQSGKQKN